MAHSLDTLAGYVVVQTYDEGTRIADRDVQVLEGAGRYAEALDTARGFRAIKGSWAVIYPVYADGERGRSPF